MENIKEKVILITSASSGMVQLPHAN